MRICHVVYGYYPQDMRSRRAAEHMLRLGHEVHVISMMDEEEPVREDLNGIVVHRIPVHVVRGSKSRYVYQYLIFLIGSAALLLGLYVKHRFDVVHVHSLPDMQVLCAVPEKLLGSRIVLDLHEAMPELFAARFGYRLGQFPVLVVAAVERMSCGLADCVIVVNDTMRRRLEASGIEKSKMVVVMNSPPLESVELANGQSVREELGIGEGHTIVYVGGVNRERDLTTLVRAVSILQQTKSVGLAIIGHGDEVYRAELIRLAHDEGLDAFSIHGRVRHDLAAGYISQSELGPITYERNLLTDIAMPTKALEYSAAGKPLVIADLRAIREIYGDGALYYEPGNAASLAEQIARIWDDSDLAQTLAARGRLVLETYSWNLMASRLQAAYEAAVS